MMDLKAVKDANALKFKVGDQVRYKGAWGTDFAKLCEITGVGEKNGLVFYDNSLGHWGFVEQYALAPGVLASKKSDPDAGIDRPVQCHNLDRATLQRLSHPCGSDHDYYKPGDPAGSVRVVHTLADGRFLVETPDEHGVPRFYIANTKSYLVLVEDVTRQWVDQNTDWEGR